MLFVAAVIALVTTPWLVVIAVPVAVVPAVMLLAVAFVPTRTPAVIWPGIAATLVLIVLTRVSISLTLPSIVVRLAKVVTF